MSEITLMSKIIPIHSINYNNSLLFLFVKKNNQRSIIPYCITQYSRGRQICKINVSVQFSQIRYDLLKLRVFWVTIFGRGGSFITAPFDHCICFRNDQQQLPTEIYSVIKLVWWCLSTDATKMGMGFLSSNKQRLTPRKFKPNGQIRTYNKLLIGYLVPFSNQADPNRVSTDSA